MTTQDEIQPSKASKALVERIETIIGNDPDPDDAMIEILWRLVKVAEQDGRAHAVWALDQILWLALFREHRLENLPEPVKHPV